MKRLVIFGATGLIGRSVSRELREQGHMVQAVSRKPTADQLPLDFTSKALLAALSEADGVLNLAGSPIIGKRLTPAYRQVISDSRIGLTHRLVSTLSDLPRRPGVLVSASATGYYGTAEITDAIFTEQSPAGSGFWGDLCQGWEAAAAPAEGLGIQTVMIRTGLILDSSPTGTFAKLRLPFLLGVGGPIGYKKSWRSWIHLDDEVGIILHALLTPTVHGPLNATAPEPLVNTDFAQELAEVLHRPSWFNAPEWAVGLLLGEVGEVVTRGKRILPEATEASGYQFRYPTFRSAISSLI